MEVEEMSPPDAPLNFLHNGGGVGRRDKEEILTIVWEVFCTFFTAREKVLVAAVSRELHARVSQTRSWDLTFVRRPATAMSVIKGLCGSAQALKLSPYAIMDQKVVHTLAGVAGPNLRHLDLQYCSVLSDASLEAVAASCPFLEYLDLQKCYELTDEAITALAPACPRLSHLNLRLCFKVTDKSLAAISQHCTRLTFLDLRGCSRVGDRGLMALAEGCHALEHLDLWLCERVTDDGIGTIARSSSRLTWLRLRGCYSISDKSLTALSRHCPLLRSLDLQYCGSVSSPGLAHLGHLKHLQDLNLSYCSRVGDSDVLSLAEYCPNLKYLDLTFCYDLSPTCLADLMRIRPDLHVLPQVISHR